MIRRSSRTAAEGDKQSGPPPVALEQPRNRACVFLDTDALVALLPWDWWKALWRLSIACKVDFRIPPQVRREYRRLWTAKLSHKIGKYGAKFRRAILKRLDHPGELTWNQKMTLAAFVTHGASRLGKRNAGEAEAIAYAIMHGGHCLSNNTEDTRAVRAAIQDLVRTEPSIAGDGFSEASASKHENSIVSSSAAPLILACEAEEYGIAKAKKVAEHQREAGESPPAEWRLYMRVRRDPAKRRRHLRRQPKFWRQFYAERWPRVRHEGRCMSQPLATKGPKTSDSD